jgi:hypothetical protein
VGITTQITDQEDASTRYFKPVYNLAPEAGGVAKLGFYIGHNRYVGDVRLRAPGEGGEPYSLRTTFHNVTGGFLDYDAFSLTIWGVPAASIHDPLRWMPGPPGAGGAGGNFGASDPGVLVPYLTNPTSCATTPLQATLGATSYQQPERSVEAGESFGPIIGCDRLGMEPALTAETTSDSTYAPTGFDLATKIPQTYQNAEGLSTSTLKKEVVTLPEGMTVNPSSGAGLAACTETQYAEEEAKARTQEEREAGHGCPNESKLATVRIKTPSISEEVTGSVYLATPAPNGEEHTNPFKSLLAVYLIARASERGVLIKAPGLVQANPETGRLTTTFDNLPPLPFSLATFAFNQGANAPLVTPPTCGRFTVTAELTPWSNPEGSPLTPEIQPFPISTNCPSGGVPPFAPQVTAGTLNNAAGSYSPLDIKLSRNDGEQEITGFASQMPPGLTANLTGIPFCGEGEIQAAKAQTGAEAEEHPACPSGSEIGHSIAEAGVGTVLAQAPGRIYLGGPYQGAPFSIVSVTAAKVGPFDLGTVVVHLPLFINPETAAVTVGSGSSNQIPHIIKGIVIHVRNIRVYVSRANFTENPTSCTPMSFGATVIGGGADPTNPADNTPATVTDPFQAAECASLKFEPKISVSTSGKTSKSQGASLTYKIAYPNVPQGTDADIHYVKVELPGELPSRLTTLQKACTQGTFKVNPADCPKESVIGHAKAVVPNIPVPLEGPVYFVSNGGEAFPNLVMVLQGYGVTIDLIGDTLIKNGVTSTTFNQVPDNPLTSFEINLPEGPYSALAANGNLCKPTVTKTVKKKVRVQVKGRMRTVTRKVKEQVATSLTIPSDYVGQNGAVYKVNAPIAVTGCPKAKVAKKAKRKAKRKAHKK